MRRPLSYEKRMAETGKRRAAKATRGPQKKAGKSITLRIPEAWLAIADSVAEGSELGATRTSVLRAAIQKGLSALAGRSVG